MVRRCSLFAGRPVFKLDAGDLTMTRKSTVALTLILALTVGAFLLTAAPASPAHAQQPGKAFRALWFLVLPAPEMLLPTDTWGGSIFASLEGQFLLGGIAGNDLERDRLSFVHDLQGRPIYDLLCEVGGRRVGRSERLRGQLHL